MNTHPRPSALSEEIRKLSRKLTSFAHEIEAARKRDQTKNRAKFFLDCVPYEERSSVEVDDKIWIDAETSDGRKFKISLCSQSPPGFSRLFVKADNALPDYPASSLSDGDVERERISVEAVASCYNALPDSPASSLSDGDLEREGISVEAVASCYNAILMHTSVYSGTHPCFRHNYFLFVNDVPTPKISRLPEMPGPHQLNIGLLHHECGHYTVAVLKESMISTIATDSSLLSGYEKSKLTEGPCVCTLSTSTCKWMCRYVSLPGDLSLSNWNIDAVLAYANSFWWVDLRCGILSYDIDQQQSVLGFIPLPSGCYQDGDIDRSMIEDRSVSFCDGELRCVHIFRKESVFFDYGMKSQQCEDSIKIWSWRDGNWFEEYEMKFAEFWKGTTFTSKCLPKLVPAYPAIDPHCPNLVYFFLSTGHRSDGYVIGVDLLSMKIQYCGDKSSDLLNFMQGLKIYEFSEA